MSRRFGVTVGLTVAGVLIAAWLPARGQQQGPVFRGGVTEVNVDVYPRRDGHVVEGLTAGDFQVLEDGKPQQIETFEFIPVQPNTPDAERRDPKTKEDGDKQAADPHNRVLVFFLDLFHMNFGDAGGIRGPLTQFIGHTIGTSDLFSVVTPTDPSPVRQMVFGRRTDTFESDLADWTTEWASVARPTPAEVRLDTCVNSNDPPTQARLTAELIGLYRQDLMFKQFEDLMTHLRDLRDERKNVVFVTEAWVPQPSIADLVKQIEVTPTPHPGTGPDGRLRTVSPQQFGAEEQAWCNQQIGQLVGINFDQRFHDLLVLANQANVAFYPVDVGGLRVGREILGGGVNTLRTMADATNGVASVNTNDLAAGLRKVSDDLSGYYLLGYASTNPKLDGNYREIKVQINKPGVSIVARRGYVARKPETVIAAASKAAAAAAVPPNVNEALGRLALIHDDTELFAYAVATPEGADVVAEIASVRVGHAPWTGGADLQVTASVAGKDVKGTAHIAPGTRAALVHLPLGSAVAPGLPMQVRVASAVTDPEVLTALANVERASNELLGGPLCFRGTSSARIALRPVADFEFRRDERLHVEWPVLKPLDQRTARVLDRRGQPLAFNAAVTETTKPETGRPIVAVDVSLASFAEGDYLLELTAGQGGHVEHELVAFRVTR